MNFERIFFWGRMIFIGLAFIILMLSIFHVIDFNSPIAKAAEEAIERQTGVEILFPGEKSMIPCDKEVLQK